MTFGSPEETAAFLKRCRKRHKALRKEAAAQGARLFVERSRPFAERIEAYWMAAASRAGKPAVVEPPRQDNVVAFGDLRTTRAS